MRTALFIVDASYLVGGLHTRYRNLGHVLPRFGWRPVYAMTRGNRFHDPRRLDELFAGLETTELDARSGTWDARIVAVARALDRVRPDVLVTGAGTDAWFVMQRHKAEGGDTRVVCGLPGIHPKYAALLRRFRRIVDAAYGVSPLTAQLLRDVVGIAPERVFYIPTGVEIAERPRAARHNATLRLVHVGRLTLHKRVMDLVPLCAALERRGVAFSLTIVGEGPLERQLRDGLAPFGERIRFEGAVSNATIRQRVLPAADVCLLLSDSEGTPNALLEAMAAGTVIATSDFHGREESGLLRAEETALVFAIGDMEAAAERLATLAANGDEWRRFSANARAAVTARHSMPAMGAEFSKMLSFACEGPPMAGAVEVPQLAPAGRLTRALGPAGAELVRRLLRRRFPHPDAGEWPATEGITAEETAVVIEEMESIVGGKIDESQ